MNKNVKSNFSILKQIAIFCDKYSINYTILTGYLPNTSQTGRDIDVFVPKEHEAKTLIRGCKEILTKAGFKWHFVVHPIWGFRCIGISDSFQYFELHLVTKLKVLAVPVSNIYPLSIITDTNGIKYDPKYIFFKSFLIKYNRKILSLESVIIKDTNSPGKEMRLIQHDLQDPLLGNLLHLAFKPTSRLKLLQMRITFIRFLMQAVKAPIASITFIISDIFKKKIRLYLSPCVPIFHLRSYKEMSLGDQVSFKESLIDNLKGIFLEIHFIENEINISRWYCQKMRARQCLVIFTCKKVPKYQPESLTLNCDKTLENNVLSISHEILEKFAKSNKKWTDRFI